MDYYLLFAILFTVGTLFLIWRKQERFLLFFMIRTKYFTPLIDWIANLSPWLWKFLADLSVVVSFGGLGAAYLSGYRKDSRNLDGILFLFGLAGIVLWWQNELYAGLLFLALLAVVFFLNKVRNPIVDFLFSAALVALDFMKFVALVMAFFGAGGNVPYYISIVMGAFGIPLLLIGMFFQHAADILVGASNVPGVAPILPTVSPSGEVGVGVPGSTLFIPLVYAAISFIILLGTHEFAHGVLARVHGIKIKSTGLLTFGIVPVGAFVEPDDAELEKKPSIEKMRVFSAGSFANLMVCAVGVSFMLFMSYYLVNSDGATVIGISDNSTMKNVLQDGMVIHAIDGKTVKSVEDYRKIFLTIKPGTNVTLSTDKGEFNVIALPRPDNASEAYLNIDIENHLTGKYGIGVDILNFLWAATGWVVFFNINIALVNVLPVAPFDGWRMLREVLIVFRISEQNTKKVVYTIVTFSLILLFLNMLPLFDMILSYIQNLFLHM